MAPRLLQNFRGSRAIIVAADGGAIDVLEAFLLKLGLSIERAAVVEGRTELDVGALQADTDVLFVDGDLDVTSVFSSQPAVSRLVPVIGLVGVEAPGRLKALMNLGATAFLRKPVHVGAIYTALFLGINSFLKRKDLEVQLEEHQHRRRRRRVVVKAIILLMQQLNIDDDEAYAQLRKDSMRVRRSLEDYCEDFVNRRSTLTVGPSAPCTLAVPDRRSP